jgi:hypothetical protein
LAGSSSGAGPLRAEAGGNHERDPGQRPRPGYLAEQDEPGGLLPAAWPAARGVTLWRLRQPEVILRSFALTRRGHAGWAPLALVLRLVQEVGGGPA